MPELVVLCAGPDLGTRIFLHAKPQRSAGDFVSVDIDRVFDEQRQFGLETVVVQGRSPGDIQVEDRWCAPGVFSRGHGAHPDGADQFPGVGNLVARGVLNSLEVALGDLPQFFLAGLHRDGINQGLDLVGVPIDKKVGGSDDGYHLTATFEHLGENADQVAGLLCGGRQEDVVFEQVEKLGAEGPAGKDLRFDPFFFRDRLVRVQQAKALGRIGAACGDDVRLRDVAPVFKKTMQKEFLAVLLGRRPAKVDDHRALAVHLLKGIVLVVEHRDDK